MNTFQTYSLSQHEEVITPEDASNLRSSYKHHLDEQLAQSASFVPQLEQPEDNWKDMVLPIINEAIRDPDTGVNGEIAREIGMKSVEVPASFVSLLLLQNDMHYNYFLTGVAPSPAKTCKRAPEGSWSWARNRLGNS